MSKVKLLWGLAKVLMPDGLARMLYAGRLPVVDGRRIDAKARAASELVALIRGTSAMPTLQDSRAQLEAMVAKFDKPRPSSVVMKQVEISGAFGPRSARIYVPEGTDPIAPQPTLLFLHGGGWVQGSLETHDPLCGKLAAQAGIRVISYDYVLAPEHKFPDLPDDVLACYRGLLADADGLGVTARTLVVGGDSAGANLTAALMHDLASAGAPLPVAQLLIYPAVDARLATGSMAALAGQPLLPRSRIEWFMNHYLPEGQDIQDPRLSPLFSKALKGQPPAFVVAGGHDPLWDDAQAYVRALDAAGVVVEFARYDGQVHGFLSLTKVIGQGDNAISRTAEWLRGKLR